MRLSRCSPPDTSDKLRRLMWMAAWLLLFRFTPVPLHGWRTLLLRWFGARIGKHVAIYPDARVWAPWNLEIGANVTVGAGVELYCVGQIKLGDQVIVSQRSFLCTASHDIHSPSFDLVAGDIVVDDNAWIAAEALIGPGVTVGKNAVVAARAVVFRNVAPSEVVAGNPAQPISERSVAGRNHLKHL